MVSMWIHTLNTHSCAHFSEMKMKNVQNFIMLLAKTINNLFNINWMAYLLRMTQQRVCFHPVLLLVLCSLCMRTFVSPCMCMRNENRSEMTIYAYGWHLDEHITINVMGGNVSSQVRYFLCENWKQKESLLNERPWRIGEMCYILQQHNLPWIQSMYDVASCLLYTARLNQKKRVSSLFQSLQIGWWNISTQPDSIK